MLGITTNADAASSQGRGMFPIDNQIRQRFAEVVTHVMISRKSMRTSFHVDRNGKTSLMYRLAPTPC
jgi:hypothetical protein